MADFKPFLGFRFSIFLWVLISTTFAADDSLEDQRLALPSELRAHFLNQRLMRGTMTEKASSENFRDGKKHLRKIRQVFNELLNAVIVLIKYLDVEKDFQITRSIRLRNVHLHTNWLVNVKSRKLKKLPSHSIYQMVAIGKLCLENAHKNVDIINFASSYHHQFHQERELAKLPMNGLP